MNVAPTTQSGQVTFILTNYNHSLFLGQALEGALHQIRPADKFIIIDDGSTDNSLDIIYEKTRHCSYVEVIQHTQNKGCIARLNEGLARAETEFVSFLAADDVLDQHFLENHLNLLCQFPQAPFGSGACHIIDKEGHKIGMRPLFFPSVRSGFISSPEVKTLLRSCDNFLWGPGALFRRDFILALGGFNSSLNSLTDGMLMRHLALEHGFCFFPKALASWRFSKENGSVKSIMEEVYVEALIKNAKNYIATQKIDLFPPNYASLLERRLRFGSVRLQIMTASSLDHLLLRKIFSTLHTESLNNVGVSLFAAIWTPLAKIFLLLYTFCCTRPFKISALIKAFLRRAC